MEKAPIGFETQNLPPGIVQAPEPMAVDFADDFNEMPAGFDDFNGMPGMPAGTMATDEFLDPVAMGFHDGSLQQQLAYSMQQAVDQLREV